MAQALARNLSMIINFKSNERTGFFKGKERKRRRDGNATCKKSSSKFLFLVRETVALNIGLMESTDKNDYNLGPVRESLKEFQSCRASFSWNFEKFESWQFLLRLRRLLTVIPRLLPVIPRSESGDQFSRE